jgi:DNA polymerase-3 subunit delta'
MIDIQEELINTGVLSQLTDMQKRERLAQAYIFSGADFAGKTQTALALAKLLNCEKPVKGSYCNACPSCMKINSGNHPDVHVIDSQYGETIKIDQIREMLERIRLRPFMGQYKVFIIRRSENFTAEAANAFLKTLEEPSLNSLIILTTSAIDKNLDTVRSRCQTLYFHPLSRTELAQKMTTYYHRKPEEAQVLAQFAKGYLGLAKRLHEDGFIERKNELVDQFVFSTDAEGLVKDVLESKEKTKEFLDVLFSWVRDSILIKIGLSEEKIFNCDRLNDLKKFYVKYTFEQLNDIYNEITSMYKQLADNLNVKLSLLLIREKLWAR